jgi:hypothetical protein
VIVLLVGIGAALVAFGALVLVRFPDRPGGSLRLSDMEVSSVGAGLPLVALGVLAVAFAVLHQPGSSGDSGGGSDGGSGGGSGAPPPPENVPACLAAFFAADPTVPRERQRTLIEGLEDVKVLGSDEPKREEFALVLVDSESVVGAVKTAYDASGQQFRFDAMVDRECGPVEWTAPSVPGASPKKVTNHNTMRLKVGIVEYLLELKAEGFVEMELHRFQR